MSVFRRISPRLINLLTLATDESMKVSHDHTKCHMTRLDSSVILLRPAEGTLRPGRILMVKTRFEKNKTNKNLQVIQNASHLSGFKSKDI